jgi:hypothetical protein
LRLPQPGEPFSIDWLADVDPHFIALARGA